MHAWRDRLSPAEQQDVLVYIRCSRNRVDSMAVGFFAEESPMGYRLSCSA